MDKRLLDYNDITGLSTWYSIDSEGTEILEYSADSEPVLEVNKALQNDADYSKKGIKDGWWHYGSIPAAVSMKWLIEDGIDILDPDHTPRVLKKMNEPGYRYLKTTTKIHMKADH
jgi:hypothetical protein